MINRDLQSVYIVLICFLERLREGAKIIKMFVYCSGANLHLLINNKILYSGKVWRVECLANLLFLSVWRKKVWRMNGSAIGLSMVGINLDGFSLANRLRFAKFAKLSLRQTFPLYGNLHEASYMLFTSFQRGFAQFSA